MMEWKSHYHTTFCICVVLNFLLKKISEVNFCLPRKIMKLYYTIARKLSIYCHDCYWKHPGLYTNVSKFVIALMISLLFLHNLCKFLY